MTEESLRPLRQSLRPLRLNFNAKIAKDSQSAQRNIRHCAPLHSGLYVGFHDRTQSDIMAHRHPCAGSSIRETANDGGTCRRN